MKTPIHQWATKLPTLINLLRIQLTNALWDRFLVSFSSFLSCVVTGSPMASGLFPANSASVIPPSQGVWNVRTGISWKFCFMMEKRMRAGRDRIERIQGFGERERGVKGAEWEVGEGDIGRERGEMRGRRERERERERESNFSQSSAGYVWSQWFPGGSSS